jgi:hypothetical protein
MVTTINRRAQVTEEDSMAPVDEGQASNTLVNACSVCGEEEGYVWLCGEGYVCGSCVAEAAGIDLSRAGEIDEETRIKAKTAIAGRRG